MAARAFSRLVKWRALRWLSGAAFAIVVACNVIVVLGGRSPEPPRRARASDVILVLGAGLAGDATPSPVLEDRLATALALHRAGHAPKILVSGDRTGAYDEPAAMKRWLVAENVPESAIVMDPGGFDTFLSLARARDVYGVKSAIIVTQRFHLSRAVWVARRLGLAADGAKADKRVYRGFAWYELREVISRTKACLDNVVGRSASSGT